jgi:hypothetical protein
LDTSYGFVAAILTIKKAAASYGKDGPASGFSPRQPGCLDEIRGFPPPPRDGFGFIVGYALIIYSFLY